MDVTPQHWKAGDRVVVRATRCTVTSVERLRDCAALGLSPHDEPDAPFGALLVPFDRPRPITTAGRLHAIRPRRWLHVLWRAAAGHHRFGSLRNAARAKVEILSYQLEPALAMLRHASLRVLVADAVGLGKTIQAGLVLAEVLDAAASRALAIVPAGLRHQWASELASHFGIDAAVCDAGWLRRRTRDLPSDVNPWALPGTYIASYDFMKQPEVLRPLEELLWDLVIVDEAHLVTSGTDRRAAVDAVASRARRVMLLTGTPHSGDQAQFEALCRIGEGQERTPLLMFRRRRSDVGQAESRRSTLLRVRLSEPELRMHELLDRYTSRLWRESHARGDRVARLVAIVLRKRALSSAGSLATSLARRIDLLAGTTDPHDERQLALPIDDREDEMDDDVRDGVLGAPGLANALLERRWLGTLLGLARCAAAGERKMTRLRRYLSRVHEPAIVFTEYRDTLTRLQRIVQRHFLPVLALHGGMSDAERRSVQQSFNERDCLLLATDAAAEGLNLQQRCRIVVHFELPWNPLRLEQRTGRVDRIGQTRRVHEVALVADATAERMVLAPLARRARTAIEVAPGGSRMLELLSEMHVAEAVISGEMDPLVDLPRVPVACVEQRLVHEAVAEAVRVEEERRSVGGPPDARRGEEHRPAVTTLRRRPAIGAHYVTFIYALSLETAHGRRVHTEPLVVSVARHSARESERSAAGAVHEVQRTMADAQRGLEEIVGTRVETMTATVVPLHRAQVVALGGRETAIAEPRTSAASELVQAGLFDRRAVRRADARHTADRLRRADAEEQLQALDPAGVLTPRVTLQAALIHSGALP